MSQQANITITSFECDICDKIFNRKTIVNQHRLVHLADWKYICDRCSRQFKTIAHIIQHQSVQFDSRNYRCDVCNSNYKSIKHLNKHNSNVDGNGQIKHHMRSMQRFVSIDIWFRLSYQE